MSLTSPAALSASELRGQENWPELPLVDWKDSLETLHRWVQIVGKTRLSLAPPVNHWWHTTLYLTARGLTTSPMPYGPRSFEVELDFVDHTLAVRTTDGDIRSLSLLPRTVADFYQEYVGLLSSLGIRLLINLVPCELEDTLRFTEDREHRSYDPEYVHRCWRILSSADRVLQEFRGRFLGKCSPVHFFWGAFDLACTRFSGRRAPLHPGGVPNLPDSVVREAYSHECISAGWWPGGGPLPEPSFYAYSYPEPVGFADAPIEPAAAYYHGELKEFVLPYQAVRSADDPAGLLLRFFQTTYEAGATLGSWDRGALERSQE